MSVTKILSTPSPEFARHCLANLPVLNVQELRKVFNIVRHLINGQLQDIVAKTEQNNSWGACRSPLE
jgi:hypothetical protein